MNDPTPLTRLSNVNLLVADVPRARDFYSRSFGLALDERRSAPPSMLLLASAGCTLSLKDRATEPEKVAGPGSVELGFETDQLDEVYARVRAFGVFTGEIVEQGFGRTFDAHDPDGHHLTVYTLRPENR
jgi:predicted enzyme related to lactoylglutathione lyase